MAPSKFLKFGYCPFVPAGPSRGWIHVSREMTDSMCFPSVVRSSGGHGKPKTDRISFDDRNVLAVHEVRDNSVDCFRLWNKVQLI